MTAQKLKIRVVEHELEELPILVGKPLKNPLLLILALLALLEDEHENRERQTEDLHDVECELGDL